MEELIEKVENLKTSLDTCDKVKRIKSINRKIMKDKELLNLIKKYNETMDEDIKKEIINHKLFLDYKHEETELNLLIMDINSRLKDINSKGKCSK